MSLIQDALKRKSEEAGTIRPPEPTAPEPYGKNPGLPAIILTVLIAAAITTALVVVTFYPLHMRRPGQIAMKPEPVAPIEEINTAELKTPSVQALELPVAEEKAAIQETPEPAREPVAEPVVKEEPTQKIPLIWPELTLTGIAQGDSHSIAILNGKMLSVGRKLGEVTILDVTDRSISVEYRGERRVLYIGE